MKRRFGPTIMTLVIIAAAFIALWGVTRHRNSRSASVHGQAVLENPSEPNSDPAEFSKSDAATGPQSAARGFPGESALKPTRPLKELASIASMSQILADFARPDRKLKDLLVALKSSRQDPYIAKSESPYVGTLNIVRTNSPLPGTRYFHAQYESDGSHEPIVQHMSFEIRAGSDAVGVARSAVLQSFANLGEPSKHTADFVEWNLPDGYVVWIKKLNSNDLEGNPFNAYTSQDVGTVRVAVEKNPEGDDD